MGKKSIIGVVFGMAMAVTAQAEARSLHVSKSGSVFPDSSVMTEYGRTVAPLGHVILCMSDPSECQAQNASVNNNGGSLPQSYASIKLTSKSWAQLNRVNRRINAKLVPRADGRHISDDVWSTSGRYGDCEDYAIQKRRALIALGWPSHSLLIALLEHPAYGDHAVLIARTSNGDFVLDNLRQRVIAWDLLNYDWRKRQSSQDPSQWVSLR